MTVLYVREQGAVVRREAERVVVTRQPARQARVILAQAPVHELEQLVLYGYVQVTAQAVALLLEHEIDVIFLTLYGRLLGNLEHGGSQNARLRHAQLKLSGDEGASLALARRIVQAKLANQRGVLQTAAAGRSGTDVVYLTAAMQGIEQMRRDCSRASTLDALRGFEGKGAAHYFAGIRVLLDQRWGFQGRNFHPPQDPFNALLSFGYTLLLKDVITAIRLVRLDPYLGCFHALEYARPSLALDLMEEFRPLVVDPVVLGLAADNKIKPGDFTFTKREERPVELGAALMPVLTAAYEERMKRVVWHKGSESQNTLRRCLELQTRLFARVVMGERQEYEGLVVEAERQ